MSIFKFSANQGSICGLICFALFLILHNFGLNPFNNATFLIALIPVGFFYFSIKKYRDSYNQNNLSYGQGFRIGLFLTFFYSSLYGVLLFIYLKYGAEDLVFETRKMTMENMVMLEDKVSSSIYDKMIEGVEKMDAAQLAQSRYMNNLLWGLLISLIIAAITKKQNIFTQDEQ